MAAIPQAGSLDLQSFWPRTPSECGGCCSLPQLLKDAKFDRNELTITVAREEHHPRRRAAVKAAGYNFLEDVTAVDWYPSEPRFQISVSHPLARKLKQRAPSSCPA